MTILVEINEILGCKKYDPSIVVIQHLITCMHDLMYKYSFEFQPNIARIKEYQMEFLFGFCNPES